MDEEADTEVKVPPVKEMSYDVNMRDSNNDTALHIAAKGESVDMLELLLKNGASVNVQNNRGETPMHYAATNIVSEVVEILLRSGGSVNIPNKEGFTPFHLAVAKGYKRVVEVMLDWGAQVHSKAGKNQTALHIATTHWNCIQAETLLDRGADVNARDDNGKTPLHLAVGRVDITMTELLLERGADINACDYEGQTPLHLAANHWNYRIVKMLLDRGSLINTQNSKGQTPLHIAVINGDLTLVNRLLDRGALTDTVDSQGLTPLQYAINNDYAKLVLKLVSKGADVSVLPDSFNFKHCPCTRAILQPYIAKIKWSEISNLNIVGTNDENSKLREMCFHELERIKAKKVVDMSGNEYSLANVLDKHGHFDMATCTLFENVLNSPSLDNEFPLYAFILKVALLRMKRKNLLIRKAHKFFIVHNFFSHMVSKSLITVPSAAREIILRQLSYIDLQNLIVETENTLRLKTYSPW